MKRILSLLLDTTCVGLLAISASAATYNWTNTVSGNWSVGGNWNTQPTAPSSAIDTIIQFNTPGTYIANHDLANGFLLNQLNFGDATVTLAGNSLAFSDNAGALPQINQNGSSSVTIANALNPAANLTFGGSGTGMVTITGLIGSGGSLTHAGAGVLYLNNANNCVFPGGIIVSNNATLRATCGSATTALGLQSSTWVGPPIVLNNGTLIFDGGGWNVTPVTFSGTNTIMPGPSGGPYWEGGARTGTGKIIIGGNTGMSFGNMGNTVNHTCEVVIAQAPGGYIQCGDGGTAGSFGFGPLTFASTNGARLGVSNSNGANLRNNPVILQTNLWYFGNYGNNQFYMYGNITGPGSLGKEFDTSDSNTGLYLVGTNTYSGGTIWLSGYLRPYNTGSLGVGPVTMGGKASSSHAVTLLNMAAFTLTNNFILIGITNSGSAWNPQAQTEFNTAFNLTLSGSVSGSGGLLKSGSATLTLSGLNTFSGPVTVAGGILDLNGYPVNNAAVYMTGGTMQNATLQAGGYIFSGGTNYANLAGSGVLTINGGNTALFGTNTYTSGTMINSGSVTFMTTNARPVSGTITVASGATLGLGVAGAGCFSSSDLDAILSGTMSNVSAAAGSYLGIDTSVGNFTYSSSVPATTLGLTKLGANTLTLSGASTYSGGTIITAGRLLLGAANAITNNGAVTVAGGIYDLNTFTANNGVITMTSGAITNGTLNGSSYTFSGGTVYAILGGSGALTNIGGATTLNGLSGVNTFTGGLVINGGTLTIDFANQTTDLIKNSNVLTLGGGTLTLKGASGATDSQTFASTTIATNSGSTITLNQNGAITLTLALGAITRNTGSVLNFSVAPLTFGIVATTSTGNDASGIIGPWLTVDTTTALQYGTVNGSQQIISYTGATAGTAGTLANVTNPNVNYSFSAGATMVGAISGNTLRYTGSGDILDNVGYTITLNGLMNAGSGTLTFNGAGNLVIGASKELVITLNNQSATFNCPIADNGGGASSVTFCSQGGTLTLNTVSTYTGGTVLNGGTVSQGNLVDGVFGTGPITLNGGAAVTFSRQNDASINSTNQWIINRGTFNGGNSFSDKNYGSITLNGYLTIDPGGTGNRWLYGPISGSGGIIKIGNANLYILGNSSYSGGTSNTAGYIYLYHTNGLGTGPLWMSGGQLTASADLSGGTGVKNNLVLLQDSTINLNSNALFSGFISGSGGITLSGGAKKFILSGTNTYCGNTVINSGILIISNSLALQNSALFCNNFSPNTNVIFAAGITNFTLGGLIGTNNLALTNQAGVAVNLTVGSSLGISSRYDGALSGGRDFTKIGSGVFTISATSAFTNNVTINAGTLVLQQSQVAGSNANIYLSGTGVLNLNFAGVMTNHALYINGYAKVAGDYGSNNVPQITGTGRIHTLWPPPAGMVVVIR